MASLNIAGYFKHQFEGREIERAEDYEDFDLESACGMDCKQAIDAAVLLYLHAKQAFGESSPMLDSIAEQADRICACYAFG